MEIALIIAGLIAATILFLWMRAFSRRREAAINVVLGKATYLALAPDDQSKVSRKAEEILRELMAGRFNGFNSEVDRFGWYAIAMAHLAIPPVVNDYCYPKWYFVDNPFFAILPGDKMVESICRELKNKHRVEVVVSQEHKLFDRIRDGLNKKNS
jgi:hypothetical protein